MDTRATVMATPLPAEGEDVYRLGLLRAALRERPEDLALREAWLRCVRSLARRGSRARLSLASVIARTRLRRGQGANCTCVSWREDALTLWPKAVRIWRGWATRLEAEAQYALAQWVWQQVIELRPGDAAARLARARCLSATPGGAQAAEGLLAEVLRTHPTHPEALRLQKEWAVASLLSDRRL